MNWIVTHLEIVLAVLLVLVAAIFLLQQRRTPQSTVAWLLAMVAVPYLAVPLFLVLGFRKHTPRFNPIAFSDSTPDAAQTENPTDHLLQSLGLPAATAGNDLRLLDDGQDAWQALTGLVASARQTLDVQFYIVANDPVGRAFVEHLTEMARNGVRVRLLLDRLGSLWPPHRALNDLKAAGGQVLFFSPFLQIPSPGHLNLRNHRKLVIADGVRAFSGGMNVGQEYMGPQPDAERWADLAFLIDGPTVPAVHDVFLSDWAVAGGGAEAGPRVRPAGHDGGATLQPVPSGPDLKADPLHDALVRAIHVAQTRVWIVTPYFLPTELLGHAFALAARRGVDVRLILPRQSNQKLADFARGAYLREMAEAGVRVQYFERGMIHAKGGLVDDIGFAGSANFDVRSMLLNFELNFFVYDPASVTLLENWFGRQENSCREGLRQAGWIRRVLEGVFRLGAPFL